MGSHWIKGEKRTLFSILIVTIIVSQIIRVMEDSKKEENLQIEASDICLDYNLNENTGIVSLYLLNKSQIAAHGVKLAIHMPKITPDVHKKRALSITKTGDCEFFNKNDRILTANFSNTTIYPTFSDKKEYPVIDFKFNGVTIKELKETEQSIEYIINCDEGEFRGRIPVFYIFTVKKIR